MTRSFGPYLKNKPGISKTDLQVNLDSYGDAIEELHETVAALSGKVSSLGSAFASSQAEGKTGASAPGAPSLSATGEPVYIEDPAHPGTWIKNPATPDPMYWLQSNFTSQGAEASDLVPHTTVRVVLAAGTNRSDGEVQVLVGLLVTTPASADGVTPAVSRVLQCIVTLTQADCDAGYVDVETPGGVRVNDTVDAVMVAAWNPAGYEELAYAAGERRYVAGFGPPLPEAPVRTSLKRDQHHIKMKLRLQGDYDLTEPYTAPGCINYLDSIEVWTRGKYLDDGTTLAVGIHPDDTGALGWEQEHHVGLKRLVRKIAQQTKAGKAKADQSRDVLVSVLRKHGKALWIAHRYRDWLGQVGAWGNITPAVLDDDGKTDIGYAPPEGTYHANSLQSWVDDKTNTAKVECSASLVVDLDPAMPKHKVYAYMTEVETGTLKASDPVIVSDLASSAVLIWRRAFKKGNTLRLDQIEVAYHGLRTLKAVTGVTRVAGQDALFSVAVTPANPSGAAPLAVDFSSVVTGGTAPYAYDFDYGDGSAHYTTNGDPPSHSYGTKGTYLWVMTVTDANGRVCQATGVVQVAADGAPGADGKSLYEAYAEGTTAPAAPAIDATYPLAGPTWYTEPTANAKWRVHKVCTAANYATTAWLGPRKWKGDDGAPGADGGPGTGIYHAYHTNDPASTPTKPTDAWTGQDGVADANGWTLTPQAGVTYNWMCYRASVTDPAYPPYSGPGFDTRTNAWTNPQRWNNTDIPPDPNLLSISSYSSPEDDIPGTPGKEASLDVYLNIPASNRTQIEVEVYIINRRGATFQKYRHFPRALDANTTSPVLIHCGHDFRVGDYLQITRIRCWNRSTFVDKMSPTGGGPFYAGSGQLPTLGSTIYTSISVDRAEKRHTRFKVGLNEGDTQYPLARRLIAQHCHASDNPATEANWKTSADKKLKGHIDASGVIYFTVQHKAWERPFVRIRLEDCYSTNSDPRFFPWYPSASGSQYTHGQNPGDGGSGTGLAAWADTVGASQVSDILQFTGAGWKGRMDFPLHKQRIALRADLLINFVGSACIGFLSTSVSAGAGSPVNGYLCRFDDAPSNGAWSSGVAYTAGQTVTGSTGKTYKCLVGHTSAAATAPETGANWARKWLAVRLCKLYTVAAGSPSANPILIVPAPWFLMSEIPWPFKLEIHRTNVVVYFGPTGKRGAVANSTYHIEGWNLWAFSTRGWTETSSTMQISALTVNNDGQIVEGAASSDLMAEYELDTGRLGAGGVEARVLDDTGAVQASRPVQTMFTSLKNPSDAYDVFLRADCIIPKPCAGANQAAARALLEPAANVEDHAIRLYYDPSIGWKLLVRTPTSDTDATPIWKKIDMNSLGFDGGSTVVPPSGDGDLGGTCFLGGMELMGQDGPIPYSAVQPGDIVGYPDDDGHPAWQAVESVQAHEVDWYWLLNGWVGATYEHLLFAWAPHGKPGRAPLRSVGSFAAGRDGFLWALLPGGQAGLGVTSAERVDGKVTVYSIKVPSGRYWVGANGTYVLAHNMKAL